MAGQQTGSMHVSIPPGTRFGRYEVITEIASGGMATVFLGRALGAAGFARLVAIKCLHPHVAKDDEFVQMFMDEARLAARIRHPNVVPTQDLENGDDGLFLVMDFVDGEGLLGLLRGVFKDRKRVPVPIALRIALDVCAGLHAAHELTGQSGEPLRLVHRDVSPHNILVGVDGISRITDFGIARAEERLSVTRDGQIKGKIAYMAPEQTSGVPVDRRADLWSLGVVLWECLAGRRLFFGQNDGEVLRNLLVHPIPRLKELVPEIPEALDAAVMKALARDPDERYATASQMAESIEEAGGSVGIASARAVGTFVREIAGERIEALHAAARAAGADGSTSAVRPVTRTKLPTDPERTAVRDEPPKPMELPPGAPSPSLVPQAPSNTTTGTQPIALVQKQSNTLLYVLLGLVGIFALLGAGAVMLFLRARHGEGGTVTVTQGVRRDPDPTGGSPQTPSGNGAGMAAVASDAGVQQASTDDVMTFDPSETGANEPSGRTARNGNGNSGGRRTNVRPTGSSTPANTGNSAATGSTPTNTGTNRTGQGTQPFNPEAM
ncbi:MAG: serine/threonine protein kinase [Myxococcales bacterium]|nr:serine/threonine protein kinase [Myxococcales bacterium]